MLEPVVHFREKLRAGQLCVGCGITMADPVISEVIAPSADFLWIDTEHSHLDLQTVLAHLMSARIRQVPAFVRVPGFPNCLHQARVGYRCRRYCRASGPVSS